MLSSLIEALKKLGMDNVYIISPSELEVEIIKGIFKEKAIDIDLHHFNNEGELIVYYDFNIDKYCVKAIDANNAFDYFVPQTPALEKLMVENMVQILVQHIFTNRDEFADEIEKLTCFVNENIATKVISK